MADHPDTMCASTHRLRTLQLDFMEGIRECKLKPFSIFLRPLTKGDADKLADRSCIWGSGRHHRGKWQTSPGEQLADIGCLAGCRRKRIGGEVASLGRQQAGIRNYG